MYFVFSLSISDSSNKAIPRTYQSPLVHIWSAVFINISCSFVVSYELPILKHQEPRSLEILYLLEHIFDFMKVYIRGHLICLCKEYCYVHSYIYSYVEWTGAVVKPRTLGRE